VASTAPRGSSAGRRDDRASDALEEAHGDQGGVAGRQRSNQRCGTEDHEAQHEHAPCAVAVGQPAAEEQEAAERQAIGDLQ
jgi:hypothetical protein